MEGFKKGLSNFKKKLSSMRKEGEDFSDAFNGAASETKRGKELLEEVGKGAADMAAAASDYSAALSRTAQALLLLSQTHLSGMGSLPLPPLLAAHLSLLLSLLPSLASLFESFNQQLLSLLSTFLNTSLKDLKEVNTIKGQCYQAYEDREAQKLKVPSLLLSLSFTFLFAPI